MKFQLFEHTRTHTHKNEIGETISCARFEHKTIVAQARVRTITNARQRIEYMYSKEENRGMINFLF